MTDRFKLLLQYDSVLKVLRVLRKKRDDKHLTPAFEYQVWLVTFSLSDEATVNHISNEKPSVSERLGLQLSKPCVLSVFHHEFNSP